MTSQRAGRICYRSDWPEQGLAGPLSPSGSNFDAPGWRVEGGTRWRWISKQDDFESRLYGVPVWNLSLEVEDAEGGGMAGWPSRTSSASRLQGMLKELLHEAPWTDAYVASKVVSDEPLHHVLIESGFEPVEHRCLYESRVSELSVDRAPVESPIQYHTFASIDSSRIQAFRERILDLCKESMQEGHSRHFNDPFLVRRAPGLTYILEVMKQNFERVPLEFTLFAEDTQSDRLCGFSMLSERRGLAAPYFTQLLSAVGVPHRGSGVYAGLTRLLTEVLPSESRLLNVTHANNHAMRRAYRKSGRRHLADTLVLRRVF